MMSSMIDYIEARCALSLQSKSGQSMLSLFSNSKMDHIVGLFAIAYASSLTFINDPHITFQKLMRPDLIKCLKSV